MEFIFKKCDHPAHVKFLQNIKPFPYMKYMTVHRKSDDKKVCVVSEKYAKQFYEKIRYFEVKKDDVWIVTYPKSGTTWAQEMIWLITNDLDYKTAKEIFIDDRWKFLEICTFAENFPDTVKEATEMASPRFIKTHLPLKMLPYQIEKKKPKIVYVARNVKDVLVSYYHHNILLDGYRGSFEIFAEAFLEDLHYWSPYWDHVLDFWKIKQEENILFLTYEEMKANLPEVIKSTCKFFNKSYNEDQLAALAEHLSFNSMKENPSCNNTHLTEVSNKAIGMQPPKDLTFMRSGEAGGWKKEISEELSARLDEWSKKHTEGTNYKL